MTRCRRGISLSYSDSVTIWRDLPGATTTPRDEPAVITIGTFDGVHRGHRFLLEAAAEHGRPVVAVTFDPHPTEVVRPDRCPPLLTTVERRVELLLETGADEVRVLAFDRPMADWSPQEFVDRVLVEQLHASTVVVGENFTYGSRAAGDIHTLAAAGDFDVVGAALVGDGGTSAGEAWSSTRIRGLVAEARLREAAELLGRPHEVSGVVTQGEQRGRELGYPTANVPVDDRYAVPPDGVYAGRLVRASGEALPAAISIGTNPTFGEHSRRVESYVLDRTDLDLYGEAVRVELVEHLRGMVAFDGVDALLEQMAVDVDQTRSIIGA